MRKFAMLLGAAISILAILTGPTAPVYAEDNGDGDRSCDSYEICLRLSTASDFDLNGAHAHTFYYSNWQHDQEWLWGEVYGPNWFDPSIIVMDNVKGVWNRDSSCSITMWDITSTGVWVSYASLARGARSDVGYNINNAHSRC